MKKILFMLLLATGGFAACKKDNTNSPSPSPGGNSSKVKTEVTSTGMTTYTYDGNGRLMLESYADGGKTQYEYLPNKISENYFDKNGVNIKSYFYEIDANGLNIKETRSADPSFSSLRFYNAEKQLIKVITNQNGNVQSEDFFYSKGNCDSTRFAQNGNWSLTVINTYYPDKKEAFDNDAYGTVFFGKGNTNLQKTELYTYSDGSNNGLATYDYEFDTKDRPVKETSSHKGNINITYYTYE